MSSSRPPPAFLLLSRLILKISIELLILFSLMIIGHYFPFIFDVFVELMSQFKVILAGQVDFVNMIKVAWSVHDLLKWLLLNLSLDVRFILLVLCWRWHLVIIILELLCIRSNNPGLIHKLRKPRVPIPWIRKIPLVQFRIFQETYLPFFYVVLVYVQALLVSFMRHSYIPISFLFCMRIRFFLFTCA